MDKLFIIPHTHYDAEVFLTREEYLEVGYKVIFDALNLLKTDPDYKYSLDQSAFIQPFLKAYPELRDTFIEMVKCGRLEIIGGMEVMSDLNVTSGESIIRQFLVGKGYFQKELGIDVKTGWMIDTFGHCLQMPQIMRKCGFEHYAFSRVAHVGKSEFYWQGIDGSRIATHWMPLHYAVFSDSPGWFTGFCEFVMDKYSKLKKYASTAAIAAPEGGDFTHPVRHDTDFMRQWNAKADRLFDLLIGTPGDFFAEVLQSEEKLPVVTDDFNPVFQGCYSARIAVKQQNRRMETLLHDAEAFNGFAQLLGGESRGGQIRQAWELMLFSQVHDVIGGVQMDKVYQNVQRRYFQSEHLATMALEDSLDALVARIDTQGEGIPLVVFNPLSWPRVDKATAEVAFDTDDVFQVAVVDSRGSHARLQIQALERYPNGALKQARLLFMASCPATGYEVYHVLKNAQSPWQNPWHTNQLYGMEELDEGLLENDFFQLKVDLWKGCITSLMLKETGEEFIDPALPYGNMLVQDEDNGDFWEIGTPLRGGANRPISQTQPLDIGKAALSIHKGGMTNVIEGNVCTEFTFAQMISGYDYTTAVRIYAGLARVEIESTLTNRQKNVRYRVAFPTPIKSGTITQEIPFGSLRRPEGEYPAINWNDYSGEERGLGVINCGLPGNSVIDGKMMLSILKCTSFVTYGDAGGFNAANSSEGGHEVGVPHTFRYALVPHKGSWREAGLPLHGMELNHPLTVRKATKHIGSLPASHSFLHAEHPQAIVTAVMADGGSMLVRIYETTGKQAENVKVTLHFAPSEVIETNMLGQPLPEFDRIELDGHSLSFRLKPYEVRTFCCKQGG